MHALLWRLVVRDDGVLKLDQSPHFYKDLNTELRKNDFHVKPRDFNGNIESGTIFVLLDSTDRIRIRGEEIGLVNFGNMWVDDVHKMVFKGLFHCHWIVSITLTLT